MVEETLDYRARKSKWRNKLSITYMMDLSSCQSNSFGVRVTYVDDDNTIHNFFILSGTYIQVKISVSFNYMFALKILLFALKKKK